MKNATSTDRAAEKHVIAAAMKFYEAQTASMGDPGYEGFLLQAMRVNTKDGLVIECRALESARKKARERRLSRGR